MSANGIIPDPGYGGIVVSTLPPPSGVTNAYVPPDSFTVSSALTFYGSNCSANRFDPQQLNAFESEMLALAATLAPNGTWNSGVVTNLAAAFQTWAQAIVAGTLSLSPSSAYPGANASNTTAATPAYVTAAINAAVGAGYSIVNEADYPSLSTNDTRPISAAYWSAAFAGSLVGSGSYPSSSSAVAAAPSFVNAAIAAATTTIEGMIPALAISSAYPDDSNNTEATTPAYVAAARAAAIAAIPALAISSSYPDASDNAKAATPAYVAAAISSIGGVPTLTMAGAYPDDSDDSTAATPAYVAAARAAAVTTAEAAIPALTVSSAYPDDASNSTSATPAYVAAARAAAEAAIPALALSSAYPEDSNNVTAATPAYVAAARAAAEAVIPALAVSSSYPDASDNTKSATPAYVAAAVAAVSGGSGTLAGDSDVGISSPANEQILAYISGTSKWENVNFPYNVSVSITGLMNASEVLMIYAFPAAAEIPSGATNSQAVAVTAATASTTVTILKNGSSIGSIAWAASGTVGTFTFTSAVTFAAGDTVQLVAPGSPDATLANVGITLAGYRI